MAFEFFPAPSQGHSLTGPSQELAPDLGQDLECDCSLAPSSLAKMAIEILVESKVVRKKKRTTLPQCFT